MGNYSVILTRNFIEQTEHAKGIYAQYGQLTPIKFEQALLKVIARVTLLPYSAHIFRDDPTVRFLPVSQNYHFNLYLRIDEQLKEVTMFRLEWQMQNPASIDRKVNVSLKRL